MLVDHPPLRDARRAFPFRSHRFVTVIEELIAAVGTCVGLKVAARGILQLFDGAAETTAPAIDDPLKALMVQCGLGT